MDVITDDMKIDGARLEAFAGKVMSDIGGAMALLLAYVGDHTGRRCNLV